MFDSSYTPFFLSLIHLAITKIKEKSIILYDCNIDRH